MKNNVMKKVFMLLSAITELQNKEGNHSEVIQQLQEFDKQLQKGIADLTTQAEKELSDAKTWVQETFVTIELYGGLLTDPFVQNRDGCLIPQRNRPIR